MKPFNRKDDSRKSLDIDESQESKDVPRVSAEKLFSSIFWLMNSRLQDAR